MLSLSLSSWKNIFFVFLVFRDDLLIEHHSETFLISLLAISIRSFTLLCEEKKLVSSANIIGLSICCILLIVHKNQEKEVIVLTLVESASWKSKARVTSSNPRVTSSNPWITTSNLSTSYEFESMSEISESTSWETKSTSWEIKTTSYEIKCTSWSNTTTSYVVNIQVKRKNSELKILNFTSYKKFYFHCLVNIELKSHTKVLKNLFYTTLKNLCVNNTWPSYFSTGKVRSIDSNKTWSVL